MYRFYGNSTFKLGHKIQVISGCGLDSGKTGTVINHFHWREEEGAYQPPSDHHVPVLLNDGKKHYFWKYHLFHKQHL